MYNTIGKSNIEIYEELTEMMSNGEKITIQDIRDIVATRSIVDTAANDTALTIFYSGESEKLINTLVDNADDSVRVIRRTEAFEFVSWLGDEENGILDYIIRKENPDITTDEYEKELIKILYETSVNVDNSDMMEGEGLWTVISRRFAADTKGDAYSLCANARADRIYAMDELRTWMANSSADAKMAGYTNAELQAMESNEARFAAVKAWTVEDMKNTMMYYDKDGVKVGQTFQGTSLEKYANDIVPTEYTYKIDLATYVEYGYDYDLIKELAQGSDATRYMTEAEIKSIYSIDGEITDAELLALKYLELSKSDSGELSDFEKGLKIAEKYKSSNFQTKYGMMSDSDLSAKYALWNEMTDSEKTVIKAQEYYKSQGITDKYDIYNCYDAEGKFLGLEVNEKQTNHTLKTVTGDIAYKGLTSDIVDFASDDIMQEKFGADRYELLTATERMEVKEIDKVIRDLTVVGDHAYASNLVDSYISGANKSIDSLDNVDKALIGLADTISNKLPDGMADAAYVKYLTYADKYNDIAKKVGVAGGVIDVVCCAIDLGFRMYEVNEALKAGDKDKALGIVVGSTVEYTVSIAGGTVLTEMISPYLIGLGAATLGPAGAILGGILAGVVGYGVTGIAGHLLCDGIIDAFDEVDQVYTISTYDPLAIDFDEDGFELLSLENGVYFDEDGVDLKERTQWIAADDGLLAVDLNGDGIINDGSELLGTSTKLEDGSYAKSGFEALAQYDTNEDGIIDENDDVFSKLVVWQDKNSDGISQEDELYAMNDIDVESISVKYENENEVNIADFTFTGGKTIHIGELDFESKMYDTVEKEEIEISEEILNLPNVRAIGKVASLHTLMQQDETGVLKELVNKFVAAESTEEKEQLVTDILYFAGGARDVASDSRGAYMDAQKLVVVESFMGKDYDGRWGSNPTSHTSVVLNSVYDEIYDLYYNFLDLETSIIDYLKLTYWISDEKGNNYLDTSLFDSFVSACIENDIDMTKEVVAMGRYLVYTNSSNQDNINNYLLNYVGKKDYLEAIVNCDDIPIIRGTQNGDYLSGSSKNDILVGGVGNDSLNGGVGNDTYILNIGDGEDTINDYESSSTTGRADRIVFGEGIKVEDVSIARENNDVVIRYGENDKVTVENAYYAGYTDGRALVENIEFADGTVWDAEEIKNRVKVRIGTESDDTMYGYNDVTWYDQNETFYGGAGADNISAGAGKDVLYGEEGDDVLKGDAGEDILVGGAGNDSLNGGCGNDTYILNIGDGEDIINDYEYSSTSGREDRIIFGKGITVEDVSIVRENADFVIRYGEDDKVIVKNAYYAGDTDGSALVENIEFADGTVWDAEEIKNRLKIRIGTESDDTMYGYNDVTGYDQNETFYGGAGADNISAGAGKDVLYGEEGDDVLKGDAGEDILVGGAGNDSLNGGYGNDTYVLNIGDGEDIINDYEYSSTSGREDRIVFGEGITVEDVSIVRENDDFVIRYGENDKVTVQKAYYKKYTDGRALVENIEFADGTVWDAEEIKNRVKVRIGTESDDTMYGYNDVTWYDQNETFYGGAGADNISAGAGEDVLYGEEGDDVLKGDAGEDILVGGAGNDSLNGGYGNDTYVLNIGDGEDIINEYEYSSTSGREDRIVFGEGITVEDVSIARENDDFVIRYGENDKVTVQKAYYKKYTDGRALVENIEFADGTVWDAEEIKNRLKIRIGTESDDTMYGYNDTTGYDQNETFYGGAGADNISAGAGEDVLYGEEGDDVLKGDAGEDILVGGAGNDSLNGGYGNDTYVLNIGDGEDIINDYEYSSTSGREDRIVFGEGITVEDVSIVRENDDFVIRYGEDDKATVQKAYYKKYTDGSALVEKIEFADGTVWDAEEIKNRLKIRVGTESDDTMYGYNDTTGYDQNETFYGGAGADYISAGDGEDILVGGTGNDTLNGGVGEDVYFIGMNDGNDIINNYDTSTGQAKDKIIYGQGILADELILSRQGNDLLIKNSKTEQITTIANAFRSDYYKLYNLEFDDASIAIIDYATTTMEITCARVEESMIVEEEISIANELNVSEDSDVGEKVLDTQEITNEETSEGVTDTQDTTFEDTSAGVADVQEVVNEELSVSEVDVKAESEITAETSDIKIQEDDDKYDVTVSESVEVIAENNETSVLTISDMDSMVDNAVQAIEDLSSQDSIVLNESSTDTEEVSVSSYAEVSDSDINKMADLIVQEMAEPSSQSVVQDNSVTEINNESVDVQLWAE